MIIKGKYVAYKLHDKVYNCAMDITMDYIGGKWKSVVLWYLMKKRLRFGDLKKAMPDITEKMLSIQLRKLEKDGLIKRHIFAEVPPRVEYTLTEAGESLTTILNELAKWGRDKGYNEGKVVKEPRRVKKTVVKKK